MPESGLMLRRRPCVAVRLPLCAGLLLLLWCAAAVRADVVPKTDWPNVNGDKGGTRYSPLAQIHRGNVRQLKVAWTYHAGDGGTGSASTIECTPIVAEGVMFVTSCSPRPKVIALDAATGRERWKFDPYDEKSVPACKTYPVASGGVNRGVAYWSDGRPGGARRVLHGTADGRLLALNARTGRPEPAFGQNGTVDLREGMDRDLSRLAYGVTSAPGVFENLVILGFSVGEGPGVTAPGDVRAFDVRTGKEAWRFHTVPRPGEFGSETWRESSWKERGGANAWSGVSIDARRGIVFAALGAPAFDFYGGDRKGRNLFANCVLALDARTGKRLWHFQTVRHDLWDYDNPCPPVVVSVRQGGRQREAVAQVTKTGFVFLLDRQTGAPLFPVEERSVPASDVPGEEASPTQVFPLKPPALSRQGFGPGDVTDLSKEGGDNVRAQLGGLRHGPIFTPPSLRGTVVFPGYHGGGNWSGASFDPTTGVLYVNTNDVPWISTLSKETTGDGYGHTGYHRFRDGAGYPAVKPPWGHLTAVDLNRGEFLWRVPLGEHAELKARGVPPTGTENFGGTIVTAGGLVFVAGTMDEKFRAFDKSTGKVLWEHRLPTGGYATPAAYAVNGRQYVVIAAGGGGKLGTRSGDAFVAFALPEEPERAEENPVKPAKIVFLAGKKSHGPGEHEYEKGLALLQQALETSPSLPPGSVRAELHTSGWPADPATLDDADVIVLFSDGSDHNEADHPLLTGDRLERLGRAMKRGAGLVALHYTLFVPNSRGGPQFLEWLGGYFDYQSGPAANGWYSKIQTATTLPIPAAPEHPIARGLRSFPLREEYYYNLRFRPDDARVKSVLLTSLPGEPGPQVVAWAVERADGGRGFAFTGGHFHGNWRSLNFRRMVLNAIVWAAKRDVPRGGVRSLLSF